MYPSSKKSEFLANAKAARSLRQAEKHREVAIIRIQKQVRGWLCRSRLKKLFLQKFDDTFPNFEEQVPPNLPPAIKAYKAACGFLFFFKGNVAMFERFERLCRYILSSLSAENPKLSYISVAFNKTTAIPWISHMKVIILNCALSLEKCHVDTSKGLKDMNTLLRMLVELTCTNTWSILNSKSMAKLVPGMNKLAANFMGHLVHNDFFIMLKRVLLSSLCNSRVTMRKATLTAILTLALRPVIEAEFSNKLVSLFLLNILSVPGLVMHLQAIAPESLALVEKHEVLHKVILLLSSEQELKIHFNALEGSYSLCLTGNLIQLLSNLNDTQFEKIQLLQLTFVITGLLESCGQYVTAKQSNLSHWHPVLGWFSVSLDSYLQASMERVKLQMSALWSPSCLKLLLKPLIDMTDKLTEVSRPPSPPEPAASETNAAKLLFRRALQKTKSSASPVPKGGNVKLGSPECRKIATICTLYQNALKTLSQLKLEILAGLCYQNFILFPLWKLLQNLGPNFGYKAFLDLLSANAKGTAPEFQVLILFCDCLTYVVTILDDIEMYEKEMPFNLNQYCQISKFLNAFLHKGISTGLMNDPKTPLFISLHSLLMLLYNRDNRRNFTKSGHWLIRDIRISSFLSDLDKGKHSAVLTLQKLPHVIPHSERVGLFRKKVNAEKTMLGLTDLYVSGNYSNLISVHRSRIVEDGYRQLSSLSANALKGIIRVKFVNIQGLDEAGIDQDGVFKEFLEETIKKVFDPGLNLFCTTSEERLYPSPMSYMTENHLLLFEFVGKMIGKAVYEGIVVDVPFASFFLSQVLGKDHSAFYSYIDELPSLDPELYRNLTYMKHYEGDVADLDLTFSFDQDMMGQIVTHELVPGGKAVAVTNDNKISYMHHVAHFRMHSQIKEQIAAFTKGFRTIIPNDWLQLFSPLEVQRLISGDNTPLDLKDLRRNTHYYGGFHDSHRVVSWLWDILEKDFSDKEKGAFLKFVTSCSKPPLLGFEHLEPPFSIRCVEVGDDEDDGDTVGSVLRGFLALRHKDPVNRLPTASTCFNLLKLPNYQKKSTLKEKLRYAISCNTGFELS